MQFLDDFAYLLGLTCGRGTLDSSTKILSIQLLYRSIKSIGITQKFDQRENLIIGLDPIVNRLSEFTGKPVKKEHHEKHINLVIPFHGNNHTWQALNGFFNGTTNYSKFTIPEAFQNAPKTAKIGFLQGFADVAGFVRKANADPAGRHRVYFEISNSNWHLPIQICTILQSQDLNIPVETITWGHPNTRGAINWGKEHQLKLYVEYFLNIGFTIDYKNRILFELAEANIDKFGHKKAKFCYEKNRHKKEKEVNPDEHSLNLPEEIRGNHFDSFWQICRALGCNLKE